LIAVLPARGKNGRNTGWLGFKLPIVTDLGQVQCAVDIRSVGRLIVKRLTLDGGFAEALALEREPVSVVHQSIENGVGESRITDDLVPMVDRKLAGHHGRSAAVPILHDLQEAAPRRC
jgi:hypothetical protein